MKVGKLNNKKREELNLAWSKFRRKLKKKGIKIPTVRESKRDKIKRWKEQKPKNNRKESTRIQNEEIEKNRRIKEIKSET